MADISGNAAKKVEGAAQHDSAVIGWPLLGGGEARVTLPTAVGDGDAVRQMHDDRGRQVNHPFAPRQLTQHQRTTLTNTTETTILTLEASTFHDLVLIIIVNESNTDERIDIRDDTGGTIRINLVAAAGGGGCVVHFAVPMTQALSGDNWTAQLATSPAGGSVYVFVQAIDRD